MSVSTMPAPDTRAAPEEAPRGGRRKKLLVVLVVLAVLGGAGYWFFLRPSGDTEPVPGEVVSLESTQINLAGGHYLRIAIALQLTESAHEVDGSKALDATISLFSGKPMAELNDPRQREKLKKELSEELDHRYHGDVMEVYFTEFVTQ